MSRTGKTQESAETDETMFHKLIKANLGHLATGARASLHSLAAANDERIALTGERMRDYWEETTIDEVAVRCDNLEG